MAIKFCINCGYELPSIAKFCPACGTNQSISEEGQLQNSENVDDKDESSEKEKSISSESDFLAKLGMLNSSPQPKKPSIIPGLNMGPSYHGGVIFQNKNKTKAKTKEDNKEVKKEKQPKKEEKEDLFNVSFDFNSDGSFEEKEHQTKENNNDLHLKTEEQVSSLQEKKDINTYPSISTPGPIEEIQSVQEPVVEEVQSIEEPIVELQQPIVEIEQPQIEKIQPILTPITEETQSVDNPIIESVIENVQLVNESDISEVPVVDEPIVEKIQPVIEEDNSLPVITPIIEEDNSLPVITPIIEPVQPVMEQTIVETTPIIETVPLVQKEKNTSSINTNKSSKNNSSKRARYLNKKNEVSKKKPVLSLNDDNPFGDTLKQNADEIEDEKKAEAEKRNKRVAEGRKRKASTGRGNKITQKDIDKRKIEEIYQEEVVGEPDYDRYYENVLTIDHDLKINKKFPLRNILIIIGGVIGVAIFLYFYLKYNFDL